MASDITEHIGNFSIQRGVDNAEASGSIALSNIGGLYERNWTGTVKLDSFIKIDAGYTSVGDPAVARLLSVLVSGADTRS